MKRFFLLAAILTAILTGCSDFNADLILDSAVDAEIEEQNTPEIEPFGFHHPRIIFDGTIDGSFSRIPTINTWQDDNGNIVNLVDWDGESVLSQARSGVDFGINERSPGGLAWDGTNLYMIGNSTDALYKINRADNHVERVSNVDNFGRDMYVNAYGLAWDGKNLYTTANTRDLPPGATAWFNRYV